MAGVCLQRHGQQALCLFPIIATQGNDSDVVQQRGALNLRYRHDGQAVIALQGPADSKVVFWH